MSEEHEICQSFYLLPCTFTMYLMIQYASITPNYIIVLQSGVSFVAVTILGKETTFNCWLIKAGVGGKCDLYYHTKWYKSQGAFTPRHLIFLNPVSLPSSSTVRSTTSLALCLRGWMTVESRWRPRPSWARLWEQLGPQCILPWPPTDRGLEQTQTQSKYRISQRKIKKQNKLINKITGASQLNLSHKSLNNNSHNCERIKKILSFL